jgi:hypothetical protein
MRDCVFFCSLFCSLLCFVSNPVVPANGSAGDTGFIRGDSNDDGAVDLSDASFILSTLFTSSDGPGISCADSADTDDDGVINLTDAVRLLNFLFRGGEPPAPPFQVCGGDPTGDVLPSCDGSSACSDDVLGPPVVPPSEAVVFVIERSGIFQTSGQLNIAKREVRNAIDRLKFNTKFGVVFFDSNVSQFPRSDDLLPANGSTRLTGRAFVAGMPGGSGTCAQTALVTALRMIRGARSEIKRVVFISSGAVFCRTSSPTAQILAAVREANATIGAKIDTFGLLNLQTGGSDFLSSLAAENAGCFVHVLSSFRFL